MCIETESKEMWERSCFLMRLLASSVRLSESAGRIIKDVLKNGDLKIVDKSSGRMVDLQTEADRSSQQCIIASLHKVFGDKLTVIGEEESVSTSNGGNFEYSTDVLKIDDQCPSQFRSISPSDIVVWVDPLDGTSEFALAAKGQRPFLEQVTVLIGIAHKGRPIAGVIHQPYWGENQVGRTVWGLVGVGVHGVKLSDPQAEKIVVTTRSHPSEQVNQALEALRRAGLLTSVKRVGGAGFKILQCLEGAAAYVYASAGLKRWDTAAPEAIIISAGGDLTDISGQPLYYGADAQFLIKSGVVATANWTNHKDFIAAIPDELKSMLCDNRP